MHKYIGIGLLAAATCAIGQTGPHDGAWTAHFQAGDQARQARVVIKGQGGTWQTLYLPQGADICFRLEVPLEVLSTTPQEISFAGRASRALAGCADGNPVTLKRVDDKTLEGALSDGRPVKLVR